MEGRGREGFTKKKKKKKKKDKKEKISCLSEEQNKDLPWRKNKHKEIT